MYFEHQINKDYFYAAAEIIVGDKGAVEISPGMFMVADSHFKIFSQMHAQVKIIDEIVLYHKTFLLVRKIKGEEQS